MGTDPSDHEAIMALIQRYADSIDAGDLDGLADMFVHGVIHSPLGEARGRDAVRQTYDGVLLDEHGRPGTHHVVFDVEIDVDDDRATATSCLTVVQDGMPIIAGRYHDRFVRDSGGWRFDERVVYMDLIGDMSRHFRPPRRRPRESADDTHHEEVHSAAHEEAGAEHDD